ncbi:MAG: trigger factor [Eubacteriales bacterium]
MTLLKKELVESNRYKIEFSVDKETFAAAVDRAFHKKAKTLNLPGFRKGKAPRNIIEKMYGRGVFYDDAINDCLPAAYEAALKEAELSAVGQPEFDVVSVEGELVLSATVYVKPEVQIEGYFGLEAKKEVEPVTDEEIGREVDSVRERNARTIEVTDRAAAEGDTVSIDFAGTVDGVPFDGGTAENFELKLGSGQFIPGFEEQVAGKEIGSEFDVSVSFPEDYHEKTLAGKPAIFKVKLHAIKVSELPEPDDEFAKDVSEFDTLDAYRADIKAKMQERNEKAAESAFENQLCEKLIEKLQADIPEPMFVQETENFVRDYDNRLRMQGLDLNTYFKYTGMNLDTLRQQLRPQAERQVKLRLSLEKIAELESVSVPEAEIEAEYERMSTAYNMPLEQVKSMVAPEDVAADMKTKAALDLVKAKASVVA